MVSAYNLAEHWSELNALYGKKNTVFQYSVLQILSFLAFLSERNEYLSRLHKIQVNDNRPVKGAS